MIDTVDLMNAAMAASAINERLEDVDCTIGLAGTLPKPGLRINIVAPHWPGFLQVTDRLFDWAELTLAVDEDTANGTAYRTAIYVSIAEEVR